jgi:predicted DNA-binding protein
MKRDDILSIRLPADLKRTLAAQAKREGRTLCGLVRWILQTAAERK